MHLIGHRDRRKIDIFAARRDGHALDLQNGGIRRGDVQQLRERLAQGAVAERHIELDRMRPDRPVQLRKLRHGRRAVERDEQGVRVFRALVRPHLRRVRLPEQQPEAVARPHALVVRRGVLRAQLVGCPAVLERQHRRDLPAVVPRRIGVEFHDLTRVVIDRLNVRRKIVEIIARRLEELGVGERGEIADLLILRIELDRLNILYVDVHIVHQVADGKAARRIDHRAVNAVRPAAEEGIRVLDNRQILRKLRPMVRADLRILLRFHAEVADLDRERVGHLPGRETRRGKAQKQQKRRQERGNTASHGVASPR